MADENKSRELTMKLDVDCSEALTGLKAIQREAKKATQALKELEAQESGTIHGVDYAKDVLIERMTTKELHEELARREGVTEYVLDPEETAEIATDGRWLGEAEGPARIVVNCD